MPGNTEKWLFFKSPTFVSPLLRSSVPIGHAFQIYLEEHLTEMMITYTLANYLQALKKKKNGDVHAAWAINEFQDNKNLLGRYF